MGKHGSAENLSDVVDGTKSILHICRRDIIQGLRDRILRLHGYEVESKTSEESGIEVFERRAFDLVLIDVDGQGHVPVAERFCEDVRTLRPGQKVAFVCNYMVSIQTDCPDEIIEAEFNPEAFVDGVRKALD